MVDLDNMDPYPLRPIGFVRSKLKQREDCPKQGYEGAPNPEGESFGLARLKDALDANAGTPLSGLKSVVLKTLHEFTEKELTHDDVTLIAMEIC